MWNDWLKLEENKLLRVLTERSSDCANFWVMSDRCWAYPSLSTVFSLVAVISVFLNKDRSGPVCTKWRWQRSTLRDIYYSPLCSTYFWRNDPSAELRHWIMIFEKSRVCEKEIEYISKDFALIPSVTFLIFQIKRCIYGWYNLITPYE